MIDPTAGEGLPAGALGPPPVRGGEGFLALAGVTALVSIAGLHVLGGALMPFTGLLVGTTAGQLVFFLGLPAAVAALFKLRPADLGLALPSRGTRIAGVLFIPAGLALLLQYQSFQEAHLFRSQQALEEMYRTAFGLAATPAPILYLCVGLVPALAEEFLFRGFLLSAVARKAGAPAAVIATSLLFAAVHPPLAMLPILIFGILLASITTITGSLLPAVLMHLANNAMAVAFLLHPEASDAIEGAFPGHYLLLGASAAAVFVLAAAGLWGGGRFVSRDRGEEAGLRP